MNSYKRTKELNQKMSRIKKQYWKSLKSKRQRETIIKNNSDRWEDPEFRKKTSENIMGEKNGMYGKTHSAEARKSMSKKGKGRKFSEEHKRKIGLSKVGIPRSEETVQKLRKVRKGIKLSEETKQKMRGKIPWNKGKKDVYSKSTLKRMGEKSKARFLDPDFLKKWRESVKRTPNKSEKALMALLDKLFPSEYKYVGDAQFWLGGKNPDFMNVNGQKKLIELYGDYWHRNDDPQERIDHFKKYGFDTLVIWGSKLKKISPLSKKLEHFANGKDPIHEA